MSTIDLRRAASASPAHVVLRRIASLAPLSDREAAVVLRLGGERKVIPPGVELFSEGRPMARPRVLLSGWAARCRTLPDGRRQIFSFVLPGDVIGLPARPEPVALATTVSLTLTVTGEAWSLAEALERPDEFPGLTAAVWAMRAREAGRILDQAVRLGRQTAYERLAHLLLELHGRLVAVDLADERHFPLPLTQEMLADALGLSIVHVNRILQQMRRDRLVEVRGGQAELLNREELVSVSDFRPARAIREARPPRSPEQEFAAN